MGSRSSKKSRKKRGKRTHGRGSSRNARHSGHKGGKGAAGSDKHLYRKTIMSDPRYFGKHGFKRPPQVQEETSTVNIGELNEWIDEFLNEGLAEEEDDHIVIDVSELGFDKVLGKGKVTRPLKVVANGFSKKAESKLKESGGVAEIGED